MKKILFLAAVTAIALTACTKTETTAVSEGNVIRFDNAFVGNPTKVNAVDNETIEAFYVYASKGTEHNFFDGDKVYKSESGSWIYDNLKQWEPDTYVFAAYSDGGITTETGKVSNSVTWDGSALMIQDYEAGDNDLVASISATQLSTVNNPVAFSFSHTLSMLKFTIKSELGEEMKISSFKVTGLNNKANLTFNASSATWTDPSEGEELNSNDFTVTADKPGESDEFIVIPQDNVTLTVTFTAAFDGLESKDLKATIPNTSWDPAFRYNYVATVTGEDMDIITFADPTVSKWNDTSWTNPIEASDVVKQ